MLTVWDEKKLPPKLVANYNIPGLALVEEEKSGKVRAGFSFSMGDCPFCEYGVTTKGTFNDVGKNVSCCLGCEASWYEEEEETLISSLPKYPPGLLVVWEDEEVT